MNKFSAITVGLCLASAGFGYVLANLRHPDPNSAAYVAGEKDANTHFIRSISDVSVSCQTEVVNQWNAEAWQETFGDIEI